MERFTSDEILKVIKKLVGETNASGDSAIDKKRLDNLRVLIDVIDGCLDGITCAARTSTSYMGSEREIGRTALRYLAESAEWFGEKKRRWDNECECNC